MKLLDDLQEHATHEAWSGLNSVWLFCVKYLYEAVQALALFKTLVLRGYLKQTDPHITYSFLSLILTIETVINKKKHNRGIFFIDSEGLEKEY